MLGTQAVLSLVTAQWSSAEVRDGACTRGRLQGPSAVTRVAPREVQATPEPHYVKPVQSGGEQLWLRGLEDDLDCRVENVTKPASQAARTGSSARDCNI